MNPDFQDERKPNEAPEKKVSVFRLITNAIAFLLLHVGEQILHAASFMWQSLVSSGLAWLALYLFDVKVDWFSVLIVVSALKMNYKNLLK